MLPALAFLALKKDNQVMFQRAPTLGGECYEMERQAIRNYFEFSFNGHPPLGVNATV